MTQAKEVGPGRGHGHAGKEEVNPAARHDPPGAPDGEAEPPRPLERQVKGRQSAELNPLDPGGIGG